MVWHIFDEMNKMQEEMNKAFSAFFVNSFPQLGSGRPGEAEPEERMPSVRKAFVDVQETDKDVIVTAELPGMEKEDIDLNITSNRVEIKGEKKEEQKEEKEDYKAYSSRYAGFYRGIPLPAAVDPDNVKATYKNGVLEVTLPKKEVDTRTVSID